MPTHSVRLQALAVPAILALSLFGAGSVSAAEPAATTTPNAASSTVAGTGLLTAQGDGRVQLGGTYVLVGSLDGGTIRIDGAGAVSSVRVTGWISKTRLADGTLIFRFGDKAGHYVIAGRTIVTRIQSHSMRFEAGGHGRAWLIGAGTYFVNGHGPFPWTQPAAAALAPMTSEPSATF